MDASSLDPSEPNSGDKCRTSVARRIGRGFDQSAQTRLYEDHGLVCHAGVAWPRRVVYEHAVAVRVRTQLLVI